MVFAKWQVKVCDCFRVKNKRLRQLLLIFATSQTPRSLAAIIMNITYRKKITAFIDVLGFSEIVLKSDKTTLETYFSTLENQLKNLSSNSQFDYFLISDTIILTAPNNVENLISLFSAIQYFQSLLLGRGIIMRGAVTIDDIYINKSKNIIVGPALVHSYNLEGLAKYPRIIIDRSIINSFSFNDSYSLLENMNGDRRNIKTPDYLLKIDCDSYIYINYLACFVHKKQNYIHETFDVVCNLIKRNFYSNKNIDKYEWLKKQIISELKNVKSYVDQLNTENSGRKYTRNTKEKGADKWIEKFQRI